MLVDQCLGSRFHRGRTPFWQNNPELLAPLIEPLNEFFSCKDRCGGYRDIRFGLRSLIDLNQSSLLEKCALDDVLVREFV